MEPMTLGSPSGGGSPAYLPSFLLGDPQAPSPDKSRNVSLAASPQNLNRSSFGHKLLFGAQYQQTPTHATTAPTMHQPTGPPTTGLFDSLRNERNQVVHNQTPRKDGFLQNSQTQVGTPIHGQQQQLNMSTFSVNQSLNPYNESYLSNNASFNTSRQILSPLGSGTPLNASQQMFGATNAIPLTLEINNNFWITVFGFPPSASSSILQHFTNCGTIVDKIFAPQNGNWMHIKFSARSECDRALNYNEKILFNNMMIGVTQCCERSILDKENLSEVGISQAIRARPLAQSAYKGAQAESTAIGSPVSALRPSGIVNKAMELFFNW